MCEWSKENETRAYGILTELQGSDIPVFYGEFVCHPPSHHDLGARIAVLLFQFVEDQDFTKYVLQSSEEVEALKTAANSLLQKIHSRGVFHYDITAGLWGRERRGLTLVDFDRAVFKDSTFFKNLLKGDEYLEGHDMAMMHSALEQLEIRADPSSIPVPPRE
jgi:tRNA A-37 threonylcarbamoyl transferase component Bud32